MKIRRSRKGAYDMRMRRSTRKTGALILDLVTLTPAGMSLPAYYTRLRTHYSWRAQRNTPHRTANTYCNCNVPRRAELPCALHIRRVTARHDRAPASCKDAKRARDGCLPDYYTRVHNTHGVQCVRGAASIRNPMITSICSPDMPPFNPDQFRNQFTSRSFDHSEKKRNIF